MNILIGLSCNAKSTQFFTSRELLDQLNLVAINIKQPAADATAIIVGVHANIILKRSEEFKNIPTWNLSAEEMQQGIEKVLLAGNPNALIDFTERCLNRTRPASLASLFSGTVVHGITSEAEAQFIRDKGGLMFHVVNVPNGNSIIEIQNSDVATHIVSDQPPGKTEMKAFVALFKQHFSSVQSQAA